MATTQLPKRPAENWQEIRDEWILTVNALLAQAEEWAAEQVDWPTKRLTKTATEERLGSFEIDQLLIHAPQGRLLLDPVARFVMGAEGLVDFSVMPSLDYATIVRRKGKWELRPLFQEKPCAWNRANFLKTAQDLFQRA
jgi:hypothetical protein